MPLINLSKNNTTNPNDSVNSVGTPLPPLPSFEQAVPVSDINVTNNEGVQTTVNVDGIKEVYYAHPEQPTTNATQDISSQLDSKLNSMQLPDSEQNNVQEVQAPVPSVQPIPSTLDLSHKTYSLEQIISEAITLKSSDIHLAVGNRAIVRVDGSLRTISSHVITTEDMDSFVKEFIKSRKDIQIDKISQVDVGYSFQDRRLRVNIFRSMGNLSIACRIIPNRIMTIEELDLPMILKEFTKIPSGLVLVTGPTGSGKSTTIAALLNHINLTLPKHIVTLEDPIEFVFPKGQGLMEQREAINDFDSWENALKAILRQDPNVVLVGEMRDMETIASTITVSETGHLVFATLHTNSASQTIDRIIDVFPEAKQAQIRAQLANVITAVVSQRLVPLSFGGRKAAVEILIATPAVKNAIREGKTYQIDNMIQTGQDVGMITMEKSLVEMVKKQQITMDVAKAFSSKPDEIDLLLKSH